MPTIVDSLATPLLLLLVPVLVSLLARDILVALSVTAVCAAGAVAAFGMAAGREQNLVIGLMSLSGMIFAVHGYQTRRTIRSVERLKDYLVDVRVATSALRNTIEHERGRSGLGEADAPRQETGRD